MQEDNKVFCYFSVLLMTFHNLEHLKTLMSQGQKNKTETHGLVSSLVPFVILPRSLFRTPKNKNVSKPEKEKLENGDNFV